MNCSLRFVGPLLLVAALVGCHCRRQCGDPDPAPAHTFGHDGTVERNGGLLGPRKYCPACEWYGTKCAACVAAESAPQLQANPPATQPVEARDEAERMISLLEVNKSPAPEEEKIPAPISPYAPLRGSGTR